MIEGEVFNIHGTWRVVFCGRVATATWFEKGPALAALSLLRKGFSSINEDGTIVHKVVR